MLDKRTRVGIYIIEDFKVYVALAEPTFKYKYIIPGGGIEGRETCQQAAIRESKEEIGIIPKNVKLINHPNNPYLMCGLKEYGFKYDCSELYYTYGEVSKFDNSNIETYNGYEPKPILLSYYEIKKWLEWCLKITKTEIPRHFKYNSDLEMLNYINSLGLIK